MKSLIPECLHSSHAEDVATASPETPRPAVPVQSAASEQFKPQYHKSDTFRAVREEVSVDSGEHSSIQSHPPSIQWELYYKAYHVQSELPAHVVDQCDMRCQLGVDDIKALENIKQMLETQLPEQRLQLGRSIAKT